QPATGETYPKSDLFNKALEWLKMIKKQIAENAEMMIEVFEYAPFNQQGGVF
ncbi:type I restriction-modification enzyme R subunit C-terminal domain-containing protein, partial [Klebsiella pneumoniae]|uniref:type I restriction-modification enzyme R subunit C-terminal domain-containing protein n=1 Tax=Klebsiella pneumoniae TaxID=573 RepID=UPI003969E197